MKKIFKWIAPLSVVSIIPLSISCGSDFDKASDTRQKEVQKIQTQYNQQFDRIESFLGNKNKIKTENIDFFYKDINQKTSSLISSLDSINKYIQNQDNNFGLKQKILENFYQETDLSLNEIKTYIDAFIRFASINTELKSIITDLTNQFNSDNNDFYVTKDRIDKLVHNFKKSSVFDDTFYIGSNEALGLNKGQSQYHRDWYNPKLTKIDYSQLAKKIKVDNNAGETTVSEHTHALGNIVKEWSAVVANEKSLANEKIKGFIDYLNDHLSELPDELKKQINLLNNGYSNYVQSIQDVVSQYGGEYPSSDFLGYFADNSPFTKMLNSWKEISNIYKGL
ncbi:MAG0770 family lipoprotein [Mycoplasmopsis sturni]|uniref:MAG0770 family lipoprotein n=1 Tax=Mycoplasmopsis sturni TaxID=39047 RepID=UPI00056368F9|nr:hypothetical protein [Mycoplasmopsis sturni]